MNALQADRSVFAMPHRQRGFTLVEFMVAVAAGLIVSLAVLLTILSMGRQFRVVGSNAAAQASVQIALSRIDDAGRRAGAGLYNNGQLLCPTWNAWKDGAVKADGAVLLPARIIDGGSSTSSDALIFTASGATGALSGTPLVDAIATAGAPFVVSNAGAIQSGDVALVGAPGSGQPCTLFQVTAAPTVGVACAGNATACKTLERAGGGSGFNPADPAVTYSMSPIYGFATDTGVVPAVYGPAVVNRLGSDFRQEAFAIQCNSLITYNDFADAPACVQTPLSFSGGANALATDVVLMHAQYGVSIGGASDVVTQWVDATGVTWGTPTAANVERIKAVRVVIVARSQEPDATNVTAATCTNAAGVVNTGPCSFQDASAPVIDLSAVSVPAGRTWRNYRYRVHQAVVPLRNVIWSN